MHGSTDQNWEGKKAFAPTISLEYTFEPQVKVILHLVKVIRSTWGILPTDPPAHPVLIPHPMAWNGDLHQVMVRRIIHLRKVILHHGDPPPGYLHQVKVDTHPVEALITTVKGILDWLKSDPHQVKVTSHLAEERDPGLREGPGLERGTGLLREGPGLERGTRGYEEGPRLTRVSPGYEKDPGYERTRVGYEREHGLPRGDAGYERDPGYEPRRPANRRGILSQYYNRDLQLLRMRQAERPSLRDLPTPPPSLQGRGCNRPAFLFSARPYGPQGLGPGPLPQGPRGPSLCPGARCPSLCPIFLEALPLPKGASGLVPLPQEPIGARPYMRPCSRRSPSLCPGASALSPIVPGASPPALVPWACYVMFLLLFEGSCSVNAFLTDFPVQ
ncbi:unnamed protein product [Arctogadus glacialis]